MFKLFLKAFGLLIATLLLSFYVQTRIIAHMAAENQRASRADFRERFSPTFYFVERELSGAPTATWQARIDAHKAGFRYPARIRSLAEMRTQLADAPTYIARLDSGKIVAAEDPPATLLLMKRMADSDYALVLEFPVNPGIQDQVMTANLAVEGLFVALFVWLLVMFFWRDMMKLNRAAEKVGEGDFDFHVDIGKRAALRPLADTFNAMKDRIAALLGSHRNLTNAVSHEFRTPITRLRFRHELAVEAKTSEQKDEQLRAMNSAIDQLDDLSTELLEYARLDRETPILDVAAIDTVAWLNELSDDARDLARAEGRTVDIQIRVEVESADGDYRYLSRAVANLLKNAVRHARGNVQVRFQSNEGKHTLHVDDDGPGIPVAEREHLFEPFTRLDKSRDRQSGGFGMGLAIVKQIARWHGGSVAIAESAMGGARVSLTW